MDETNFSFFEFDFNRLLDMAGNTPFDAMLYFFLRGGWMVIIFVIFVSARDLWLDYIQTKTYLKKQWILLKIIVPKATEQTCRAVENFFINLAGTHLNPSWTEKWILGLSQSQMSVEIASIDGQVSYYVYCERRFRDLAEASIYAQYPDADIQEAMDYSLKVPNKYPDDEWDLWGCEFIPVKADCYPLKTYVDFEDKISGELKDPLASLLEHFGRMLPGEQAWYQIVVTPTDQKDAKKRAEKVINDIKGVETKSKPTVLDRIVDAPLKITQKTAEFVLGGLGGEKKDEKKSTFPKLFGLSPGEINVLKALERKASQVGHMCKIRFIYVGKKNLMVKARIVHPFIGDMKQMNTFDMQAIKPESKRVGVNNTLWWFKSHRNNLRRMKLINAYRSRSNWAGLDSFFLSSEELATFWHFPIFKQVKAPSVLKTEAKKMEAPSNIPFGM